MEVRTYNSLEEMRVDLNRAMRAADTRVKPWQSRIDVGEFVLSVAEGEPVFSEVLEKYTEPRMEHYRFVRSFSVFVPEGELGDLHVSQALALVTKEDFEAAQTHGWQLPEREKGGTR